MSKKKKHIELTVDDMSNVKKISFVNDPAMEGENFMYFSHNEEVFSKTTNTEKRIVCGLAMRPDKVIPRVNKMTGEEYTISFSKDTVRKASELYLMDGNQKAANLEHKVDVEGVCLVESYVIVDEKCNNASGLGFKDVQEGDWWVSMKVLNDELWEKFIKAGEVKGFSIEGRFIDAILSKKEEMEYNSNRQDFSEIENNLLNFIEDNINDVDVCLSSIEAFRAYPPVHDHCKCEIVDSEWILHPENSDGGVCPKCEELSKRYNSFSKYKRK